MSGIRIRPSMPISQQAAAIRSAALGSPTHSYAGGEDSHRSGFSLDGDGGGHPGAITVEDVSNTQAYLQNEAENELGIATASKYHQPNTPARDQRRPTSRGGIANSPSSSSSPASTSLAQNFATLARLGGAAHGSEEVRLEIGGLETMPFLASASSVPKGNIVTAKAAQPGSAFLKEKEARLMREGENRTFQFNTGASGGSISSRGTRSMLPDLSSSSVTSTTLTDSSLGPDTMAQENRRALRASMEKKEELLQAARLRGGSLLQFAMGTGATSGPVPTVANGEATAPPPLKPYVRYTPKYNLPYGDVPRQAPPPQPALPQPIPSAVDDQELLAQVRSTTLFSMTGSLNTHVGVSLNPDVYSKNINADGNSVGFAPSGPSGRRSAGASGTPNRTGGGASTAEPKSLADVDSSSSKSFPSWLQLAVPSLASTALPTGVRAHSAGPKALAKEQGFTQRSEKEEKEEVDGTFLTGVNLAEQRDEEQKEQEAEEEEEEDRLVTQDDIRHFSTLTSVESAVAVLPHLLRPSSEVIRAMMVQVQSDPSIKPSHYPSPPLPYLEIPERVDLNQLMELSLEALNFGSVDHRDPTNSFSFPSSGASGSVLNQNIAQVKESTFKQYFYSPESMKIIKDTYYWVLLYFFLGDPTKEKADDSKKRRPRTSDSTALTVQQSSSSTSPSSSSNQSHLSEMYQYRAYASNLKKYAEQEGFLTKQKEWLAECEKIRQAEKESHAQIGTQIAANGGGAGTGAAASHVAVPAHKEELLFPPPPVLTLKQKRQPLVLLGDIPHFDVMGKLNTGPVPKEMFKIPDPKATKGRRQRSASTRPDYSSSTFLLSSLKSRISSNFVKLFLHVAAAHKDFFYLHYYDLLAQVIYYGFLVAYPASRPLINHTFFKLRLLQLTSYWIMGFIPTNLQSNLKKWKGDIQFITGEVGVNKAWQSNSSPAASIINNGLDGSDDEDTTTALSTIPRPTVDTAGFEDDGSTASDAAAAVLDDFASSHTNHASSHPSHSSGSHSSSGGSTHVTHYVQQLDKKLVAHLAAVSKTSRARQQHQPSVSFSEAVPGSNTVGAAGASPSNTQSSVGPTSNPSSALQPSVAASPKRKGLLSDGTTPVAASIGHLSTTSTELTGDLLIDVGHQPRRNPHRVPLRVTRRKVELHHSALISDFLESRHFAHQSNHALRIPLSVPMNNNSEDDDRAAFLDNLLGFNEAARKETLELKTDYASSKNSFNRLQSKHKKEISEIGRKFDQERERALREASAFSKTLVAEYQEKKYQEMKAPSKSLALRRLGHYRQVKEDGSSALTTSSKSEISSTLIKSALML